jgi:hypothetical protein
MTNADTVIMAAIVGGVTSKAKPVCVGVGVGVGVGMGIRKSGISKSFMGFTNG